MTTEFGQVLKDWRTRRRLSQMELGLNAEVSTRHISFLETGRARPSRSMVLRLCEELQVPRLSRNQLLNAAGLAPAYASRALDEGEMAPFREAMDWMLQNHDPFPAVAMDRHWTILQLNRSATMLLAGIGLTRGDSLIDALLSNDAFRSAVLNFDEVLAHFLIRLQTESAHLGGDPVLDAAIRDLSGLRSGSHQFAEGILPPFIPTTYRAGGQDFSFMTTLTQFGSAEDIALSELRVEMMFPADKSTREKLLAMGNNFQ